MIFKKKKEDKKEKEKKQKVKGKNSPVKQRHELYMKINLKQVCNFHFPSTN